MQKPPIFLDGYTIVEAPFMCDKVQARTHKKKRINKKWRKRYGMKEIPWTKLVITENKRIFGHPKMIARLKKEMALKGILHDA